MIGADLAVIARFRGICACVAFRNAPNLSPAPHPSARYTLAAASAATARLTKTFPRSLPSFFD